MSRARITRLRYFVKWYAFIAYVFSPDEPVVGGVCDHRYFSSGSREMSVVIGPLPQIAPKKHCVASLLWQSGIGAAEDRLGNGA